MTDQPAEPAAPEPAQESKYVTEGEFHTAIDSLKALITGQHNTAPQGEGAEPEVDVREETRRAVQQVRQREDAKKRRDEAAGRLSAVEADVKVLKEKAPREYRRSTRFMGWELDKDAQ